MKSQSYPERVFSLERYRELHNKGCIKYKETTNGRNV